MSTKIPKGSFTLEQSGSKLYFYSSSFFYVCSVKHINTLCSVATLQFGVTDATLFGSLLRSATLRSSVNEP